MSAAERSGSFPPPSYPICGLQTSGAICATVHVQERDWRQQRARRQKREHLHREKAAAVGGLEEPLAQVSALQEAGMCGVRPPPLCPPCPVRTGTEDAACVQRWSQRLRLRSAASQSPSTAPGLQQHGPGSLGVLHHVQRCLQELQVDKTHRTGNLENPKVLGRELGTAASEEEWGQPGTGDSPSTAASPKQEVQSSTAKHSKGGCL